MRALVDFRGILNESAGRESALYAKEIPITRGSLTRAQESVVLFCISLRGRGRGALPCSCDHLMWSGSSSRVMLVGRESEYLQGERLPMPQR